MAWDDDEDDTVKIFFKRKYRTKKSMNSLHRIENIEWIFL